MSTQQNIAESIVTIVTSDDEIEGARAVGSLVRELADEGVLHVPTVKKEDDRAAWTDSDGVMHPSDYDARCAADHRFAQLRGASRMMASSKIYCCMALKEAMLTGDLFLISPIARTPGQVGPSAALNLWFEGTKLEFHLSPYVKKQLAAMIKNLLPALAQYGRQMPDGVLLDMVDESGVINIPTKLKHALSLVGEEKDRTGTVSKETVDWLVDTMEDKDVSALSMGQQVRERQGRTPSPDKVEGTVSILADGSREYVVKLPDGLGEWLERATESLIDWRMG